MSLVKRDHWFVDYQEIAGLRPGKRKLQDRSAGFDLTDFRGKSVLDLGCNIGQMSLWAAECGAESVLGVEYDKAAYNEAKRLRDLKGLGVVRYMRDDLDNPLFWHHLSTYDTVLLLSVIGTKELTHPQGILSWACMKCNNVLYLEGHTKRPPSQYMDNLLAHTDFTQVEHVGCYDRRELFRCSRDVLDSDGFYRTLNAVCQSYDRIGVIGNRRAGKSVLCAGLTMPGFTILDDCNDLELIGSCGKLILFDYRAALYAQDLQVLFHVLQPAEKSELFRRYALPSAERAPSDTLRRLYTVRTH